MPEINPGNVTFRWATEFARAVFEQKIQHIVLSPGSRSTPLALAFSSHPGFQCHVHIDERAAAFTALGIAKHSGYPALLICTSGTAVANYFPAVVEACQSNTPLIVVSADRPVSLRNIGASQTIDQTKIFGDYARFFHDAGLPSDKDDDLTRLRHSAIQAIQESRRGKVVHLNFPFKKPLEPDSDYLEQIQRDNENHAERIFPVYDTEVGSINIDEIFWSDIISAEKPLIIAGPECGNYSAKLIRDLSEIIDAPVLAEPGSNVESNDNFIEGFDGFLRNTENSKLLKPDLILRFGAQPVSKAVNEYLTANRDIIQMALLSSDSFIDGSLTADKFLRINGPVSIPDIKGMASRSWVDAWKKAEKGYNAHKTDILNQSAVLTDGLVFEQLSSLIPEEAFTMLSNSFPVRDMSLCGSFKNKKMYVNRGAAGIDGILSTATGLSLSSGHTGVAFVGDLAFIHDTNALLMAKNISQPLIAVVLNNGGGTIFRMLPVFDLKEQYTKYFETPQNTAIAALCRAHKVKHRLISKPKQLRKSFKEALAVNEFQVLECVTDPDDSMEVRRRLWDFRIESSS